MIAPQLQAAGSEVVAASASSGWFEQWSILIGAVAAFLALASLLAQFRQTYWSRPVVVLHTSLASSPQGWDAVIVATNVGERAVTITRTGWWYSFGTHWEDINEANKAVKLPYRLEPHDAVVFEGRIKVADAHWTRANGGMYKRASPYWGESPGAWRNDDLPDHNQYADPFVEVVRRPRNPVARWFGAVVRRVVRKIMWRHLKLIYTTSWWRFVRQEAPKGHARIWDQPQIVWAPVEGL